jgi:hypothetical protein
LRKLAVLSLAIFSLTTSTAQAHPKWRGPHTPGYMIINLKVRIAHDKHEVRRLRDLASDKRLSYYKADLPIAEKGYAHFTSMLGSVSAWLCIHHYEGSWLDSGDPYWGGLQMDTGFMKTYGSDMLRAYHGNANVWHPLDQMIVAERARRSGRGYYPWPNTARYCGLI